MPLQFLLALGPMACGSAQDQNSGEGSQNGKRNHRIRHCILEDGNYHFARALLSSVTATNLSAVNARTQTIETAATAIPAMTSIR